MTADVLTKGTGIHPDDITAAPTDEQNDAEFKFHFYIIFALD